MLAGEGEPYSSFLCVGSVLWRARCKEGLGVEKIFLAVLAGFGFSG